MKTKWIVGIVVVVAVIAAVAWQMGYFDQAGTKQSAAVGNTTTTQNTQTNTSPTTAVTSLQAVNTQVTAAVQAKNAAQIAALAPQIQAAAQALSVIIPAFQTSMNVYINKGIDMGAVKAPLSDLQVRLSYIQSTPLTLANGTVLSTNITAAITDISKINTALQAAATAKR